MTTDRSNPNLHAGQVQPEIPRSKFARGMLKGDRDPFELRLGGFGDGQRAVPTSVEPHRGRFSEGQEEIGDEDPQRHIRRRYSEGLETKRSA